MRKSPSIRSFSLVELLVVIAIAGIMSGLAVYSFVGVSRGMRLSTAAQAMNQTLLNARQQAITSRMSRRVAINLQDNSYWTEQKSIEKAQNETVDWLLPGGQSNAYRISKINQLPRNIVIGDVGGYTGDNIRSNDKIWYVEFDRRGTALSYPKAHPPINRFGENFHVRNNLAIHLLEYNTLIPTPGGELRYNVNDSNLLSFIGVIGGFDLNNDGKDDLSGHDALLAAQARAKVASVFILTLTGRTRVFDYGYGRPWSEIDVLER